MGPAGVVSGVYVCTSIWVVKNMDWASRLGGWFPKSEVSRETPSYEALVLLAAVWGG